VDRAPVLGWPCARPRNQSIEATLAKLRGVEGYRRLFEIAYPGEGITDKTLAKAIATFERTIVSGIAPFDEWIVGKDDAISATAKRGFMLFNTKARCSACHAGWNFTDGSLLEAVVDYYNSKFVKRPNLSHEIQDFTVN
jgi:cytochrome c peroxidase